MKTNVQAGMLAYIVRRPGVIPNTPEIIGRVVYVERVAEDPFILKHIDGRMVRGHSAYTEPLWVISSRDPLPCHVQIPGLEPEVWMVHERRIFDACLRPLIDPDIDVSDEEVKELYSIKEVECLT